MLHSRVLIPNNGCKFPQRTLGSAYNISLIYFHLSSLSNGQKWPLRWALVPHSEHFWYQRLIKLLDKAVTRYLVKKIVRKAVALWYCNNQITHCAFQFVWISVQRLILYLYAVSSADGCFKLNKLYYLLI